MPINEKNDISSYDVVVLGGGPAGIAASIAAAREGARTLLVERYGFVGGMSTAALVYPWMTFHTSTGLQVIRGIAQEIVDRLQERGASPGHLRDTIGFVHTLTPYNPQQYISLAFDMMKEAGVQLLLHTFVTGVTMNGRAIESVEVVNKSGAASLKAKVFVDATGDADVAYHAGAAWEQGNADKKVQPMTMKFRMKGVDLAKVKAYMQEHPEDFYEKSLIPELDDLPLTGVMGFYSKWKEADLPIPREGVLFFAGPGEDEVLVNVSRVSGLDPTKAEHLTEGEMEGRSQVLMLERFFKQYIPGFENASVSTVGTQIGVRETRRIIGEYVLNGEDVLSGRRFDDVVARSGYPIDIHNPEGKGVTAGFIKEGGAYDIPYRSLIPLHVDNLLLAGRCISTTHEAQATTRLTPSCMALGQAAGAAAAIASSSNGLVRNVPIRLLQGRLLKGNAELGLKRANDITLLSDAPAIRFAGEEWLRLAEEHGSRLQGAASGAPVYIGTMDDVAARGLSEALRERLSAGGELKRGSYWIELRDDAVVLAGDEPASALYAVYDTFKRFAGVNWVYPGEAASIGEVEPVSGTGSARLYEPWFGRRGFVFETINEPVYIKSMIDWLAKNRIGEMFFTFTLWDQLKDEVASEIVKRGMTVTLGGHSMKFFLDKREAERRQTADHPYTAKRQLDYTDLTWQDDIIGKIADYCAAVPNLTRVSLWPEDIRSQSSDFIEHYVRFTERLNRRLQASLPSVETEHIAYNAGLAWEMLDRRDTPSSDEIDTLLAFWGRDYRYALDKSPAAPDRRADRILQDWIGETHARGRKLTVFEYYSDHYMLSPLFPCVPQTIVADMDYYRGLGVDGLTDLVVPCPGYPDYPWRWTNVFNSYVFCRALWGDPIEGILDDYYSYFPAEDRQLVRDMFELVEQTVSAVTAWTIPLFPSRVVDAAKIADKQAFLPELDELLASMIQSLTAKLEGIAGSASASEADRGHQAFVYIRHLIELAERVRNEWNDV